MAKLSIPEVFVKKQFPNFVPIVMLIIVGIVLIANYSNKQRLLRSHSITFGRIVSYASKDGKLISGVSFEYVVNGKKFSSSFSETKFCFEPTLNEKEYLQKLEIPVVYAKNNPSIAIMLLSPLDYQQYKVKVPDSTLTALNRYFKCNER